MCKTNALTPDAEDFAAVLAEIAATPARLAAIAADVPEAQWKTRPAAGGFSLLEHACHLRDIEIEGYGVRIGRMLAEAAPFLPDLDGDKLARERDYPSQDLRATERAFAAARMLLVRRLAALTPDERHRTGTLEGVGHITLEDLAAKLRQHDREHLADLAALRDEIRSSAR